MKKSKIIALVAIFSVFATSAQAYSGADFGNDVINVIQGAWSFWKNHFWIGG